PPDGAFVADVTHRSGEPKRLSWIAREAGCYAVTVQSLETEPREDGYSIRIEEQRPSQAGDPARVDASLLLNRAERAWAEVHDPDEAQRALALYQAAVERSGAARDVS